jgi:hypothetical protein
LQRKKQQAETQRQQQRRQRAQPQHRTRRMRKQPVAQAAQQRVDQRIKQPRTEQDRAQRGQRHAEFARIVVRQDHVERQRHEGQRQAQQAVSQAIAR